MESSIIHELEKWRAKNKARAVLIDIDNGYGATCWRVELWTEAGKIEGSEAEIMDNAEKETGELIDWPGLEATIRFTLDKARKLTNEQ